MKFKMKETIEKKIKDLHDLVKKEHSFTERKTHYIGTLYGQLEAYNDVLNIIEKRVAQ